jgi:trypsin
MVSVRSLAASILPLASMAAALPLEDGGVSINIVGGTTATISEFPYIVSLTEGGSHFCGGVLLNANTVLTAGHCSEGVRASAVKVRAGTAVSQSHSRSSSSTSF